MGRTFRAGPIQVGYKGLPSPNEAYNYRSAYKRMLAGEALFKGKEIVDARTAVEGQPGLYVAAWRFMRDEKEPGTKTPKGYWEVRGGLKSDDILLSTGRLPTYLCTCPDRAQRLAALPLNSTSKTKALTGWANGLFRDCKHSWAVRYLNDEVKLITLPKDVPIPIEKEEQKSNFSLNRIGKIGSIESIQTIVKPNSHREFS